MGVFLDQICKLAVQSEVLGASFLVRRLGIDRLSAGPIIGADFQHFDAYQHRPFFSNLTGKEINFKPGYFGSDAAAPLCL